jgi:hypothetical protein
MLFRDVEERLLGISNTDCISTEAFSVVSILIDPRARLYYRIKASRYGIFSKTLALLKKNVLALPSHGERKA